MVARDILYTPDYVVNSGGLISAAVEHEGYDCDCALELAGRVYDTTLSVPESARADGISSAEAAQNLWQARLVGASWVPREPRLRVSCYGHRHQNSTGLLGQHSRRRAWKRSQEKSQ